jgi:AraC-like DNA-binding protein
MSVDLNRAGLHDLMRSFHTLTGIKIVFFDPEYREILAYPETHCAFCQLMHDAPDTRVRCDASNVQSFERCRKTSQLTIYHCHAGLLEATAPITDNGVLLGYIMFGQITDVPERKKFLTEMSKRASMLGISRSACLKTTLRIPAFTTERIDAAAKVLEACISYVLRQGLVSLHKGRLMQRVESYIEANLDKPFSSEDICAQFHLSRSALYRLFAEHKGGGVAAAVRGRRVARACALMRETELPLQEIALRCGFADYGSFFHAFRKWRGVSPKVFRTTAN